MTKRPSLPPSLPPAASLTVYGLRGAKDEINVPIALGAFRDKNYVVVVVVVVVVR